jgi:hypothetical protein
VDECGTEGFWSCNSIQSGGNEETWAVFAGIVSTNGEIWGRLLEEAPLRLSQLPKWWCKALPIGFHWALQWAARWTFRLQLEQIDQALQRGKRKPMLGEILQCLKARSSLEMDLLPLSLKSGGSKFESLIFRASTKIFEKNSLFFAGLTSDENWKKAWSEGIQFSKTLTCDEKNYSESFWADYHMNAWNLGKNGNEEPDHPKAPY